MIINPSFFYLPKPLAITWSGRYTPRRHGLQTGPFEPFELKWMLS
jgi:hypothetical protein